MIRAIKHSLGLSIAGLALVPLSACGDLSTLNNPFHPRAEVRILDITGSSTGGGDDNENNFIGIQQSAAEENGQAFTLYTYTDPVVTLELIQGYPLVNFTGFRSQITLADGTVLPTKEYDLNKGMPRVNPLAAGGAGGAAGGAAAGGAAGGAAAGVPIPVVITSQVDIQFPILSSDTDIRETVYVGNNAPRVTRGVAEVELFGKDENGYDITVPISVPLSFSSIIYDSSGSIPVLAPSASPEPAASSNPNSNNNN